MTTVHRGRLFFAHLWRRFFEDECLKTAVVLSYVTLLAIVPLSAVGLAVVSAFPVFDTLSTELQVFIFRNFVPTAGETVQRYVTEFAEHVSRLSVVGVAFLLLTSVYLVAQIEHEFNRIWRVREPRSLANRLVVYWATLTVGPFLVGGSVVASSYLVSLPLLASATDSLGGRRLLLELVLFAITALAFTLSYIVVPNTAVPRLAAVSGGVLAAMLFEITKWGFTLYVTGFPAYRVIYGALATIPIFLIWICLSWVVILLGASFTAALGSFRPEAQLRGWSERQELVLLYRLVGHLWQAQCAGEARSFRELRALEPAATETQLDRLLQTLEDAQLAGRQDSDRWLLVRDPAETTLFDLYRSGAFVLPLPAEVPRDGERWTGTLRRERPVHRCQAFRARMGLWKKTFLTGTRPGPSGSRWWR